MKMINLFSYVLATVCCNGLLFANPKMEEGERVAVTITENVDEVVAAQEERAVRASEIEAANGENAQAEAMEAAPVDESTAASRTAINLANVAYGVPSAGGVLSVANLMSQAGGVSFANYPGAYHPLVRFVGKDVRLQDGSWWKIYAGDYSETKNWLTESSLSFLDIALGLAPDTVVVTANGDWPLYSTFRYHLTNQQTGKYVRVNLSDFYKGSDTRFIYSHVWLYDAFGNMYVQLTLNDGSVWNTLPIDSQCFQWKDGDVMIVGLNTDQYSAIAPYMLINVRTNDNGGAACVLYYE